MRSAVAWFYPNDSLLVDQADVIRVVDYSETSVTLEVRAAGVPTHTTIVSSEWVNVTGALEVRYRGIAGEEKRQSERKAAIQFRDIAVVDVRYHSFEGARVRGSRPFGRASRVG